jgi:hypothetical protein
MAAGVVAGTVEAGTAAGVAAGTAAEEAIGTEFYAYAARYERRRAV